MQGAQVLSGSKRGLVADVGLLGLWRSEAPQLDGDRLEERVRRDSVERLRDHLDVRGDSHLVEVHVDRAEHGYIHARTRPEHLHCDGFHPATAKEGEHARRLSMMLGVVEAVAGEVILQLDVVPVQELLERSGVVYKNAVALGMDLPVRDCLL